MHKPRVLPMRDPRHNVRLHVGHDITPLLAAQRKLLLRQPFLVVSGGGVRMSNTDGTTAVLVIECVVHVLNHTSYAVSYTFHA